MEKKRFTVLLRDTQPFGVEAVRLGFNKEPPAAVLYGERDEVILVAPLESLRSICHTDATKPPPADTTKPPVASKKSATA